MSCDIIINIHLFSHFYPTCVVQKEYMFADVCVCNVETEDFRIVITSALASHVLVIKIVKREPKRIKQKRNIYIH